MNVVDGLQEVAEVSPGGADHLVVAEVAEESHKTAPEEVHAEVEGLARAGGQGCRKVRHQLVRIDLMCLEALMLAVDNLADLSPGLHAILLLDIVLHALVQHSVHDGAGCECPWSCEVLPIVEIAFVKVYPVTKQSWQSHI